MMSYHRKTEDYYSANIVVEVEKLVSPSRS